VTTDQQGLQTTGEVAGSTPDAGQMAEAAQKNAGLSDNWFDEPVDLGAAFATRETEQVGTGDNSDSATGVEPSGEGSQTPPGTDPSRSTSPLTKESILDSLTWDDILKHPELSKSAKSYADTEHARQSAGMAARIRAEVQRQTSIETARQYFNSLSPEDLGRALQDPEAKQMYQVVSATPPPISAEEFQTQQAGYLNELRSTTTLLEELPPEVRATLLPELHLMDATRDPRERMDTWKAAVTKAIIDNRVAAEVAKQSKTNEEADKLDREASRARQPDPLLEGGKRTAGVPDLIATPTNMLIQDAFSPANLRRRNR